MTLAPNIFVFFLSALIILFTIFPGLLPIALFLIFFLGVEIAVLFLILSQVSVGL